MEVRKPNEKIFILRGMKWNVNLAIMTQRKNSKMRTLDLKKKERKNLGYNSTTQMNTMKIEQN